MIFTARQLQALHRTNGHLVLPYRARLTPLAQDWVKQQRISVGYAEVEPPAKNGIPQPAAPPEDGLAAAAAARRLLWWCDSPCGPAKAALAAAAREANLQTTEIGIDPRRIPDAVKLLAGEIKAGRADVGVLLVQNAAAAMVFANRCPSLRAVLGTCLEAVEQAVKLVAANVLVIEHPYKSLPQAKSLMARFVRGRRELSDEVAKQLSELSSCA